MSEEMVEAKDFTCPRCGSHEFGTSWPGDAEGMCHGYQQSDGRPCNFIWRRADDALYFKGSGRFLPEDRAGDGATMKAKRKSPAKPKDPLAGFLDPADAIVPCKGCGAVEGEPCRFGKEDKTDGAPTRRALRSIGALTIRRGTVHFCRRLRRLLMTAGAPEKRAEFEAKAVEMLREYLKETR